MLVWVDPTLLIAKIPDVKSTTGDDSHLIILPACPDKVNTVEFVPLQTVVVPETLPPIEIGKIVTETEVLFTLSQLLTSTCAAK